MGSTDEGGIAAVLCHNGYNGGGAATCAGGVWTLPDCVPEGMFGSCSVYIEPKRKLLQVKSVIVSR